MKINQAGIDLIKSFEGLRLTSYLCPAKIWTIGYGHTSEDVKSNMTITELRAEALLKSDLLQFERGVEIAIGMLVMERTTENQFSAFVCLAFNIGLGAFKTSTALQAHKEGDLMKAADVFLLWDKVKGKPLKGLRSRRKAEKALYEKSTA